MGTVKVWKRKLLKLQRATKRKSKMINMIMNVKINIDKQDEHERNLAAKIFNIPD